MTPTILLISGSARSGSTNTAVLRTAQAVAPSGTSAVLYQGLSDLPAFNPDDDHDRSTRRWPTFVASCGSVIRAVLHTRVRWRPA